MSEQGSSVWMKAIAVTSAVALGGGYVVWKDGQAKNQRIEALEKQVAEWGEADNSTPTLFVGPKSPGGTVLQLDEGDPFGSGEAQLMPSSKVGLVLPPVGDGKDDSPTTLIPGSKSLAPVFEVPETDAQDEEQP